MHHQRTIPELIHTAKALQTKAEHAQGKAEQFYVSLGLTLAELKERKPITVTWSVFVKKHFNYSRERADELIRIGNGATTVKETRERKQARMKKSRDLVPRGTGKLPIATSTSVQRSAAKKKNQLIDGEPLNVHTNKLVRELSEFVDYWMAKTRKHCEDHREAMEAEKKADLPHEMDSLSCILQFIELNASNLWGLGQALDGR
jgi:hypothetical protein